MADSRPLKDALALAGLGWPVFPVALRPRGEKVEKRPLLRAWQRNASTDERAVRAMDWSEASAVGVALPPGLVAVDVDDPALFEAAGLELPETNGQRTQSGGYHRIYATDGRPVRQTVKEVPGADTRVGGKGYLVAWERWSFTPDHPNGAPEWLYAGRPAEREPEDGAPEEPMETRGQLIGFAGSLRASGMTAAEVYAILEHRLDTGGIASRDPGWPWTREDLRVIAREAGKWAAGRPMEPPTIRRAGGVRGPRNDAPGRKSEAEARLWSARELLDADLPELRWVVPGLLPEGTTVLAARPKIGKSWLAYQIAIGVALGSTVLGQRASRGSSLYLALEDGPRRGQGRLRDILRQMGVRAVPEGLEVAFEWPRMGEGCEELITAWLDAHPDAVTVWVDTLARIRPKSTGRRNAYEVDYEDMGALQRLVVDRGVGLGIVHHDRKAETDDFLESVSGTHGVTGAADTIMVLKRSRNSSAATLDVTGRDIEERQLALDKEGPIWVVSDRDPRGTDLHNEVLSALKALGGSARLGDLVNELVGDEVKRGDPDYESAKKAVYAARDKGLVVSPSHGLFSLPDEGVRVRWTREERPRATGSSSSSSSYSERNPEATEDAQGEEEKRNKRNDGDARAGAAGTKRRIIR